MFLTAGHNMAGIFLLDETKIDSKHLFTGICKTVNIPYVRL